MNAFWMTWLIGAAGFLSAVFVAVPCAIGVNVLLGRDRPWWAALFGVAYVLLVMLPIGIWLTSVGVLS